MDNDKTKIDISSVDAAKLPHKDRLTEFKKTWYKFSLNKMSVVGLVIIILVILLAVFYKFIVPYPEDIGAVVKFQEALQAPSAEHLLGTDATGRDMFSRIIYAFRGALTMGVGCLIIVVPFGGILGLVAGYWNGKFISNFIMRVSDVFLALPALILVMCVSSIMEPSMTNAMLALSVSWWPWYTRLVYGIVVSTRNIYTICGSPRSQQKSHTVQRNTAKHLVAYSDKSNFGYGLGNHGRSYPELRGNGRTAADSVSWGYGLKRSKLLAGPVVDVGIPGSGDHDNSVGV